MSKWSTLSLSPPLCVTAKLFPLRPMNYERGCVIAVGGVTQRDVLFNQGWRFGTYFSCCSADFGPRLPTNQLNNNQNMFQSVSSVFNLPGLPATAKANFSRLRPSSSFLPSVSALFASLSLAPRSPFIEWKCGLFLGSAWLLKGVSLKIEHLLKTLSERFY